jgi:hypothetical protein
MKAMASLLWHKLGSIRLTVIVCLLLWGDLAWGYLCLKGRTSLFAPLNDIGLPAWMATYGRHNPALTAWFFILLVLLALLCVNTFACTTERVILLVRARGAFPGRRLVFKFAPHLMHYALIVILAGYLCSYLFARVSPGFTLVPGVPVTLPGTTARITLESFDPLYYRGNRLPFLDNRVIQPRARLRLVDGDTRKTAVLTDCRPVRFRGCGIFMTDYSPKKKGSTAMRARIDTCVRKDPGVGLYMAGIGLFTAGLILYAGQWLWSARNGKELP